MVLEAEEIMVRRIAVGLWKVRTGIVGFGRVWVAVQEREKSSEGSTEPHLGVTCVGFREERERIISSPTPELRQNMGGRMIYILFLLGSLSTFSEV